VFFLPLRRFDAIENRMFDLTEYENAIATLALVLIIIFAFAAFLDSRWRRARGHSCLGDDQKPSCAPESDDRDRASGLYSHLSTRGLGTAEQQSAFRGETPQNLEGD
jgi:hypothetical protein